MSTESKLHLSWHDSAWIPILQPSNVLEYFSQRTNPFYDRTCNNEVIRMQRREFAALRSMTGLEYELLHVQGNFLYIIRKQFRRSPSEVTPLANYYILNGIVYQAPDLHSVINSRLFSALHRITKAFDEVIPHARYHPTSGYLWDFEQVQLEDFKKREASMEHQPSRESNVQQQCVSMILQGLTRRFPPQAVSNPQAAQETKPAPSAGTTGTTANGDTAATTTTDEALQKTTSTDNSSSGEPPAKRPRLS